MRNLGLSKDEKLERRIYEVIEELKECRRRMKECQQQLDDNPALKADVEHMIRLQSAITGCYYLQEAFSSLKYITNTTFEDNFEMLPTQASY